MKPVSAAPRLNTPSTGNRSDKVWSPFLFAVALILLSYCVLSLFESPGLAYREYFTTEQRTQLEKIQTVFVDVLGLTDKGSTDATPLIDTVVQRLAEVGYSAVRNAGQAHDVVLRVKCEQRKTWEGTAVTGGDADLPDAPSRLWKGPACQLSYLLGGMKIKWQKEVRTEFEDAVAAAQAAQAPDPGRYAMAKLQEALEKYEFPLLLAAEWGHADRLLKLLDSPETSQARKIKIMSLLGEMQADEAMPKLKEALKDRDLARQALSAIGNLGRDGIPLLVEMMNTSPQLEVQAAAAKSLGQLGGLHGDASVVLPLLAKLQDSKTDWTVLTEVAWALGKIPDKRSIQPLYDLDKKLQAIRDPDNVTLKKLKEAVFWAIKQCDTWDQYS
ncbi:MAG: HEAT repeat domain-containing protein [Nitrospira sp.]|nr:HEAT repeat domain-containing protein [Nitrospira sp.]